MTKYHQLFVTHCLTSDSVLGEAGFSIRASSLKADDPLLSIAMNLNAYELPFMAYDGARPYPWEAPIRLAAIPLKENGFVAIMHSVYMETDTRGRPNSYFTHVIFVTKEEFCWRTTLKSWGAIQWEMPDVLENSHQAFNPPRWITQWPNHETNELPMLESLPKSGIKEHHFIDELYKYYQKSPKALEIVLGAVLTRLKKKTEPDKSTEPIRGYLLPRDKTKENQCEGYYPGIEPSEEDDSFWPENSQFRFGENIRETLLHLTFIAWFFPEKLLTDQGFSTYEPHKYGVSIANDKLLVGIVHAKDEAPDEMMTSGGVEYYCSENESSLAIDASDDLFKWGKQQIDLLFKKKTLINFSKEIDQVFESFKKSGWDCYQKSRELFDAIKDYEKKTNFNTTYKLLTFAKTNDYALGKFIEKQEKALPDFIDTCFKFHSENREAEFKSVLTLLANTRFFDWEKVCTHLTTDNFWKLSKKDNNFAARFSFFKSILKYSISESYKTQLKNCLTGFLFNDSCFQIWKTDEEWIWELFNFYYQINEKELAKNILSKASCDEAIKSILKQWKKNPNNNSVDWLKVLPGLMELSVKNGKGNKQFEELYNDAAFVLMLVEITNTNTYKEWKSFFHLYEKKSIEVLAKTSIDGKGMPLTSQLMKLLLNDEKLLPEEIVIHLLFSGDDPRVFKIIGNGIQLPAWLSEKIEKFLERIDPEKLFQVIQSWNIKNNGQDYRAFPFGELLNKLQKVNSNAASNYTSTEMIERLTALVAIKKYAANVPDLFEIDVFEQNIKILQGWGGSENSGLRKVVIDYLATKVKAFEDEEGGYDKTHGKFILLLLSLNNPNPKECFTYLNEKGIFLFDAHFKFIPQILMDSSEESKSYLAYSMLKNKWIQKFSAIKLLDSEFLKVKREIGNRFRLEYMPIAKIYAFLGSLFKGKPYVRYDNGRKFGQVLFFMLFFSPPLLHIIFASRTNPANDGNLIGVELLHTVFFGLISSLWGGSDFFSKANNLGKPEHYSKIMYIDWKMIWVTIWSVFGVGLSVFSCFSPRFYCPFHANLILETIWFAVYMGVIYGEDPIDVFLKPNTQVLNIDTGDILS
jgi:hypothetical protein